MKSIVLFLLISVELLFLTHKSNSNILIPCNSDTDCNSVIETSTCALVLGSYCTCPAGFTFSTDVTKCIKEISYGEECDESIQCSHMLTGAQCNGVCGCADGLSYVRGRCRKLADLNSPCRDEIDCSFGYNRESVECRDGKCQCADGFYQRFTNVCRRESINGDKCIVNADCIESDSVCSNQLCTSVSTQTISLKNAAIQTTHSLESINPEGPIHLEKSSAFSNRRIRNYNNYSKLASSDGTKFSSLDSSVKDESTQFGESCSEENKPCPSLKYSMCRRGFCQCQDGYFAKNGICKAELGEMAENRDECGSETGDFQRNRCVCENNQFYHPNMRTCMKSALGIQTSCTQNSQCSPYGASFCPAVSPRRCQCFDYAKYNATTEFCELKEGLSEYCQKTEDCKLANTACTARNTCECKSNFIARNDKCEPNLGAECEETNDCAFDNAECKLELINETASTKKCACKEEFVAVDDACLEKANNYNDTCSESEQCQPLLGDKASCIEGQCVCDDSLHFKDGQCNDRTELNEKCTKSGDCFVQDDPESVECRNGVCQCKFKYSPDTEQNRCVRPREKNSSKSTSPLKVITLLLIASAVVITGSALKDAYYP